MSALRVSALNAEWWKMRRVLPHAGLSLLTMCWACALSLSSANSFSQTTAQHQAVVPNGNPVVHRTLPATTSTLAEAAQDSNQESKPQSKPSQPSQKGRSTSKQKRKPETLPQDPTAQPASQLADRLRERKQADEIRELLVRARRYYTDGHLLEPADANAAALYQRVLVLDPAQPEALAGAKRIAGVLSDEVEHAVAAGDKARAQQCLARLRALQPAAGSLTGLEARVQALDVSPVVLSARQQDRYSRSAQSIERANSYLDNQPLNLRTLDQAADEYARASALVTTAPGLPLLKERITVAFPEAARVELIHDKSKRALKLVQTARERGFASPDLDPLEARAKATMRPGRYDVTLAECPDSVAQACASVPRE